jgi:hypothetical protein
MENIPMSASDETARDLLLAAAREVGLNVPNVGSVADFEAACLTELDHIKGGQDHGHARNGLRSAIEAAHAGNAEYVRAGLWEAKKVLQLVHYDKNPTRME